MSNIMTLTKLKQTEEDKLKSTILNLSKKIKDLQIDKTANHKILSAYKEHITQLRKQLEDLKQKPKTDLKGILKAVNETIIQDCNFTEADLKEIDRRVNEELKFLHP